MPEIGEVRMKAEFGFDHALDGITVGDVADILDMSKAAVLEMVRSNQIPGAKLIDGEYLFDPRIVMAWFQHSYTRGRHSDQTCD